jgi:hypothetical protein
LRCKCLNDIMNHTTILNKLVDFLPAICSMKIFDEEIVPHTTAAIDNGDKALNIQ